MEHILETNQQQLCSSAAIRAFRIGFPVNLLRGFHFNQIKLQQQTGTTDGYSSTQHLQSNVPAITPKPSDHTACVKTWSSSESSFLPCSTGRAGERLNLCAGMRRPSLGATKMQYPPRTTQLTSPPGRMEESREADFQVTSSYVPLAFLQSTKPTQRAALSSVHGASQGLRSQSISAQGGSGQSRTDRDCY